MKRLSLLGFFGLLASILAGCPLYSGDGSDPHGCRGDECRTPGCTSSRDCGVNETCGADAECHSGDCTHWGCVAGQTCVVDPKSATATCEPNGSGGGGSGGAGGAGGATGGAGGATGGAGGATPVVYCGNPADCSAGEICGAEGTCAPGPCGATVACIYGFTCAADGTCQSPTLNACVSDADCSSGDLCIAASDGKGGVCTAPANQCFDSSQCALGQACLAGKCTLTCASDADCGAGFACDVALGVCSNPVKACTITNDCGSAAVVCVGGACVPRSDGPICANVGDVWASNGCIADQGASFTCQLDGKQDACAAGSICLHHSCWISCDAPSEAACDNLPALNSCNAATSTSGTYNVCGGQQLGNECDPTAGLACSGGKVCIDGFCK